MKTYQVSFKYETHATYEVEAENQESAERILPQPDLHNVFQRRGRWAHAQLVGRR
mgnify:CR=1 FL=1